MIIVITGPTGTGKTYLSEVLAKKYNALIVNADSRQVYRYLNIGTAKLSSDDITSNHYLFDIVNPDEEYNLYNYQTDVRSIIDNNKDKDIIIVGGTGLYIKGSLYDYDFKTDNKDKILYSALFIGLTTDRQVLYNKIDNRVDKMFEDGLLEEVKSLNKKYKDNKILNNTIGYQELIKYLNNEISFEEAKDLIKKNSRHYAKRQMTWFKNQMNLKWFDVNYDNFDKTVKEVEKYIEENR